MEIQNPEISKAKVRSLTIWKSIRISLLNIINRMKSGSRFVSVYIIVLYFISIAADMATTYLATPDLKYEGNIFVRYFDLGWREILIYGWLHALIICSVFLISLNYIHTYYRENNQTTGQGFLSEVFQRKKLLLSFFFFGYFYKHLFNSVFISYNNYAGYLYVYKVENAVRKYFQWYIDLELRFSAAEFLIGLEVIFMSAAILFTVYQVRRIGNKYRLD